LAVGLCQDPLGSLQHSPRSLAGFKGEGRQGKGKGRVRKEEERGMEKRGRGRGEGKRNK